MEPSEFDPAQVEVIREWLRTLKSTAVRDSPTAFVRTYWDDLVELRESCIAWSALADGLASHGIRFSGQQLQYAFRQERRRRRTSPNDTAPTKREELPGRDHMRRSVEEPIHQPLPSAVDPPPHQVTRPLARDEGGALTVHALRALGASSADIDKNLLVKDGYVFWDDGEPCTTPLPLRVLVLLEKNGRYLAPTVGRTTKHVVKQEN